MVKIKFVKRELIGCTARVISSLNQFSVGLEGKIINETKSMLTLQTSKGVKRLIKSQSVIEITFDDKRVRIDGKLLQARPEERIKK